MITATLVFLVVMLQGGEHPAYAIVAQVDSETENPWAACEALKDRVDPKSVDSSKLACLEIVLHDEDGNTIAKKYPPNNGRRLGNRT